MSYKFFYFLFKNVMNKKQAQAHDNTVKQILNRFASHHSIAVQSYSVSDKVITGESIRLWFRDRNVPVEFIFVLYEMMDFEIDPLSLAPWLKDWVILKERKNA